MLLRTLSRKARVRSADFDRVRRPRARDELLVALAFATAIVSVLCAASLVQVQLVEIAHHSRAISDRGLPRVVALTRLRFTLRELRHLIPERADPPTLDRRVLAAALDAMDRERQHCETFERAGQESAEWSRVRDMLAAVRSSVAPSGASARLDAFDPAIVGERTDRADAALDRMLSASYLQLRGEAAAIDDLRAGAARRGYALYGSSVLVASVLVALSLRTLSTHRRSVADHIDELEAFAAQVAHDLRSPLMPAVLALQRAAAQVAPDDPVRPVIVRGERSLHTVERIVEGLLGFALSGAPSQVVGASTSVDETLEAIVAEQIDLALATRVALAVSCEGSIRVACSQGVLASIVGNLVGNAINFIGDARERSVVVRAWRAGRRARIEVADTGPGVPPAAEPKMFDPYVRGHTGGRGIGLGLATVKRLVVAHGGSIEYERRKPCGSVFRVDLPLATEQAGNA